MVTVIDPLLSSDLSGPFPAGWWGGQWAGGTSEGRPEVSRPWVPERRGPGAVVTVFTLRRRSPRGMGGTRLWQLRGSHTLRGEGGFRLQGGEPAGHSRHLPIQSSVLHVPQARRGVRVMRGEAVDTEGLEVSGSGGHHRGLAACRPASRFTDQVTAPVRGDSGGGQRQSQPAWGEPSMGRAQHGESPHALRPTPVGHTRHPPGKMLSCRPGECL